MALHSRQEFENILATIDDLQIPPTDVQLMDAKVLLLTGAAGTGKSQLLAEAAARCERNSQRVILLLGGSFQMGTHIEQQIISILQLDCSFTAFLDKLEGMAERANSYSYLFIDALNECGNQRIWKGCIAGLLQQISTYKRIKLALSIRTGYEQMYFGEALNDFDSNGAFVRLFHQGFWNNSVTAIQEFMNHYQIPFLPSYALSTEMTNPLFLKLFCDYYTGETVEIETLCNRLVEKSDMEARSIIGKEDADPFLNRFIEEFVELRLEKNGLSLSYDELLQMGFWHKYGLENSKIQIIPSLSRSGLLSTYALNDEEFFSFSYQKMDDLFAARHILKKHPHKADLIEYVVHKLLEVEEGKIRLGMNMDIVVELCSLYAKNNRDELFDSIAACITDEMDRQSLARLYWRSFSWRTHETLSKVYVTSFPKQYPLSENDVFEVLIENGTKERHPLNAETLHRILIGMRIADRDSSWTTFINNRSSEEERLYQLLDYFEQGCTFDHMSEGITLSFLIMDVWLFTASNRHLRDKATKVAVELLKNNLQLCKVLLEKFSDVDDPYVLERLYGAIYGACLKRQKKEQEIYAELVQYIYESFFQKDLIYPDVLVRDYARQIIERWIYENPEEPSIIDVSQIRPPYRSKPLPCVERQTYSDSNANRSGMRLIDYSMRVNAKDCPGMYGDFGRYTFQSALEDFVDVDIVNCYHFAMQYIRDDLGYDDATLGADDCFYHGITFTSQRAIRERIGKKYQWIAFHHILSRIADHSELKCFDAISPYNGPWEPYVRDIDPGHNQRIALPADLPVFRPSELPHTEFLSNEEAEESVIREWCGSKSELHKTIAERMLLRDSSGHEWVVLLRYENGRLKPTTEAETSIGTAKGTQEIWAHEYGYFVKREDYEDFFPQLREILSEGKELDRPDGRDVYQLFSREYPWAPGVNDLLSDCWTDYMVKADTYRIVEIHNPVYKLLIEYGASEEDTMELDLPTSYRQYDEIKIGALLPAHIRVLQGERQDASNADNISFNIPCIELLQMANLEQHEADGVFYAQDGGVAAFDPSICGGFDGLVIRKDILEQFLENSKYELIWCICGEKQYFYGDHSQIWSTLRGMLHLTSCGIVGGWDFTCIE